VHKVCEGCLQYDDLSGTIFARVMREQANSGNTIQAGPALARALGDASLKLLELRPRFRRDI